jgi:RNA polymerase sigma-70 factor (ECF subfamily)
MSDSDRLSRDQRWAQRISEGDYDAFESLFRAYASELSSFADGFVDSSDVAESLVQEVFFSIWERRASWSPPENLRSYLYTSVRNEALDYLDRREVAENWKETSSQHEREDRTPLEELEHEELQDRVREAIESLPERRRQVFTLSRQHGLTYREIADVLDISIKTVETQMSRALDALREKLSEYL